MRLGVEATACGRGARTGLATIGVPRCGLGSSGTKRVTNGAAEPSQRAPDATRSATYAVARSMNTASITACGSAIVSTIRAPGTILLARPVRHCVIDAEQRHVVHTRQPARSSSTGAQLSSLPLRHLTTAASAVRCAMGVAQGVNRPSQRSPRPMNLLWCQPCSTTVLRSRRMPSRARTAGPVRAWSSISQAHLLKVWAQRMQTTTSGWLPRCTSFAGSSIAPQHQHCDGSTCSSSTAVRVVMIIPRFHFAAVDRRPSHVCAEYVSRRWPLGRRRRSSPRARWRSRGEARTVHGGSFLHGVTPPLNRRGGPVEGRAGPVRRGPLSRVRGKTR